MFIPNYFILGSDEMFEHLKSAKELNMKHDSLFHGSENVFNDRAPYLFVYEENTEFATWLKQKVQEGANGIFLYSSASLAELRRHFRRFLIVQNEDCEEMYFHFYDPQVLKIFLPTCDNVQLTEFFGQIHYFLVEDEDPTYNLFFTISQGQLHIQRLLKTL